MQAKTHQVCYKYRAHIGGSTEKQLLQFYQRANLASDVLADMFLDIFGGIRPENLRNARYNTSQRNDKEKGVSFPDAPLLFFHWFTLEDSNHANPELVVRPQDVFPTFRSYCEKFGVKLEMKWADVIKATTLCHSEKDLATRAWTDRVKGNTILRKVTGLSDKGNAWFFANPDFPFQEKEVNSHSYCKSVFTAMWGEGEKSDWLTYQAIAKKLKKFDTLPIEAVRSACCRELKIAPGTDHATINRKILGKSGRPSRLAIFLAGGYDSNITAGKFDVEDFVGILNESGDKSDYRLSMPKEDSYKKMQKIVQTKVNLSYEEKFYTEFASKAMERLLSHRKNSLNMMYRRYCLDLTQPELPAPLVATIEKWVELRKQPHLTGGDISGVWEAKKYYEGNVLAAVTEAERNSRFRRANYAFLKECAQYPCENWFELMSAYQTFSKNRYDFQRLRTPTFSRHQNKPNHPSYGVSRPNATFNPDTKTFIVEILTPCRIEKVYIPCANKRATKDLHAQSGTTDAPRRTKINAMAYDAKLEDIRSKAKQCGVKLVRRSVGRWQWKDGQRKIVRGQREEGFYLYATYELENKPLTPKDAMKSPPPQWRFLAVDPGIRESMTYAVCEAFRQSPTRENEPAYVVDGIPHVKIAPGFWVKIIERGNLKEEDFKWHDKNGNAHNMDRLRYEATSRNVDDVEKAYWNTLLQFKIVEGECPDKFSSFVKACAEGLSRYWQWEDNPDIITVECLTDILKNRSRRVGANSYNRILALKTLKSVYQSVASRLEDRSPEWLPDALMWATEKIRNLRQERSRRVVNLLCQKALAHKVKAVFLEDTCLDVHSRMPKAMLRKIDIWTPRRVLELCRQQLNPLGVMVWERAPRLSSHTDFVDHNVQQPRYAKLTPSMIREEARYYARIKRPTGDRMPMYIEAAKGVLRSLGTTLEECDVKQTCRFPKMGGEEFPSKLLGWINADENAAMYFLIDGLKWLAGEKPAAKTATKKKIAKSP